MMKLILTPLILFLWTTSAGAKKHGSRQERRAVDNLIDDPYMVQVSAVPDPANEDMVMTKIRDMVLESAPLLEYLLMRTGKQLGDNMTEQDVTRLQGLIQKCPHVLHFMLHDIGIPQEENLKEMREKRMLSVFLQLHRECPHLLHRVQALPAKSSI